MICKALRLCPICKQRHLVGGHQRKCIREFPLSWAKYEIDRILIEVRRMSRYEVLQLLLLAARVERRH